MAKKDKSHNRTKPNTLEHLRSVGDDLKKTIKEELQAGTNDFFEQLLSYSLSSSSKDQQSENPEKETKASGGEIFNAAKVQGRKERVAREVKTVEKAKPRVESAIEYHRNIVKSSERASKREVHDMNQKMQEIMVELRKLVKSSKTLQTHFTEVAVEQTPTEAGAYHVNFFEWMLTVVRNAREKVEDSDAWLNTIKSKSKKAGYWGMFKKHGTTFGLSNERVVATQTG